MTAKSKVEPKVSDPLRAGPSGCVLVLVALLAAAGGVFLGAHYGLPWQGAERSAALGERGTSQAGSSGTAAPKKQLWTCSMHTQVIREAPGLCPICHMQLVPLAESAGDGKGSAGTLTIDPAVVQNMGVRTVRVKRGPVSRELRLTGYLSEAQPKVHEINLRVAGWIEKLQANYDGMFVRAGDPLFELYSPEIHQAAGELINTSKSGAGHFAGLGDAARRKLELWGVSKGQIDAIAKMDTPPRTVTFYAPASGHVLEKAVVEGAGVTAGQKLMNIVDHSQLWMEVTLHEKDMAFAGIGDRVTAVTESNPGETIDGEIQFIHPHVDMQTRAATARLVLDNPGLNFRPGMFATATLHKQVSDSALLLPREAVVDSGTRQLVFLAEAGGHFSPRAVTLGHDSDDGQVEITEGVAENDEVVTSGQFLMDSESRLKEAVQKYLHGGGESKPVVPAKTEGPPAAAAVDGAAAYDALFSEYLALQEALGKESPEGTSFDAKPLAAAAEALAVTASDAKTKEGAARLGEAAKAMGAKKGEEQREAFKGVSDAAIALAKAHPPTTKATPSLFEVYCSMAKASWLQRTDQVANPYLDMKTCGEVKAEIAVEKAP